jgi:uncharacterized protein YneR
MQRIEPSYRFQINVGNSEKTNELILKYPYAFSCSQTNANILEVDIVTLIKILTSRYSYAISCADIDDNSMELKLNNLSIKKQEELLLFIGVIFECISKEEKIGLALNYGYSIMISSDTPQGQAAILDLQQCFSHWLEQHKLFTSKAAAAFFQDKLPLEMGNHIGKWLNRQDAGHLVATSKNARILT